MTSTAISNSHENGHALPSNNGNPPSKNASRVYTPRFDLWEGDEEYILYGDMPGVSPERLDIQFEDGRLTINGRVEASDRHYAYAEYGIGDFYREFTVGESVDAEQISAEMKDGVVSIHLPKPEIAKPRRIEVKVR